MSVKIRLARFGANKKPFYRIVVADVTSPRNGRFIERVGTYDPRKNPPAVILNDSRIAEWIKKGAQPTQTVKQLLKKGGARPAAEVKAE
jgi:small subunit ribosomal protein S16